LKIDDIEYRVGNNQMSASQVFTQMRQHCRQTDEKIKHQFDTGWKSALDGVRKLVKAHREVHGKDPGGEQILGLLLKLEGMPGAGI